MVEGVVVRGEGVFEEEAVNPVTGSAVTARAARAMATWSLIFEQFTRLFLVMMRDSHPK